MESTASHTSMHSPEAQSLPPPKGLPAQPAQDDCLPAERCKQDPFNPFPVTIGEKRSIAMADPKTRRFFLGALTAASAVRVLGANDKINIGIVGLGGRGSSHLNTYAGLAEAQIVGLCDVDQTARERAQATLTRRNIEKAAEYEDMRKMFAD